MNARRIELDAATLATQRDHLALGSVVVPGIADAAIGGDETLELVRPDGEVRALAATAVYADGHGTAFAFRDLAPPALAELLAWIDAGVPPLDLDVAPGDEDEADAPAGTADAPTEGRARRASQSPLERLRGLTVVQQQKVAREGEQTARVALERLYGKAVWETLLRNPRISPPEVAHIARNGTLPRLHIELIVGNTTWLQSPQIRRALLANPRVGLDQIERVLRATPKSELKLVPTQTAYPVAVRGLAKKLLGPG